jgi:hypothetical protein
VGLVAAVLVVLVAAVPAALLVALFSWTRWLQGQTGPSRYALWAAYLLLTLGAVQAVREAMRAGVAVLSAVSQDISSIDRQRLLANGIAAAMYNGMLTAAVAIAVTLWLLFCTWRRRWASSGAKG